MVESSRTCINCFGPGFASLVAASKGARPWDPILKKEEAGRDPLAARAREVGRALGRESSPTPHA